MLNQILQKSKKVSIYLNYPLKKIISHQKWITLITQQKIKFYSEKILIIIK